MNSKKTIVRTLTRKILCSVLGLFVIAGDLQPAYSGVPVTGLLICCRGTDRGPYLVNGQWNSNHNYGDINQVRGILQNIKDAGINVVYIDMTNASMWADQSGKFLPMCENIRAVTKEKGMEYYVMIGVGLILYRQDNPVPAGLTDLGWWNANAAKYVWENWASKDSHYRSYGFGDTRKMLGLYYSGESMFGTDGLPDATGGFWPRIPDNQKDFISKFSLGTHEYNENSADTPTSGWGYRDQQQSSDGNIRFVSPTLGLIPSSSTHLTAQQWFDRVVWAKQAPYYSSYGSYDDNNDNINWGINDTTNSTDKSKYPVNDPYYYYNVVKGRLAPASPWKTADIGAVALTGSANNIGGDSSWMIIGSGSDIFNTADEFRYVHQTSTGDCSIQVRVKDMINSDPWAKAGVMIRESTAAGAKNAMICVTPGQGVNFQWRDTTNGATTNATQVTGQSAPKWLRITRTGSTFAAFRSDNGTSWTQVGTNKTITMSSSATIGLAVTSHKDGSLCTSNMDNSSATP